MIVNCSLTGCPLYLSIDTQFGALTNNTYDKYKPKMNSVNNTCVVFYNRVPCDHQIENYECFKYEYVLYGNINSFWCVSSTNESQNIEYVISPNSKKWIEIDSGFGENFPLYRNMRSGQSFLLASNVTTEKINNIFRFNYTIKYYENWFNNLMQSNLLNIYIFEYDEKSRKHFNGYYTDIICKRYNKIISSVVTPIYKKDIYVNVFLLVNTYMIGMGIVIFIGGVFLCVKNKFNLIT